MGLPENRETERAEHGSGFTAPVVWMRAALCAIGMGYAWIIQKK
jgi:hypothetical protein